MNRETVAIVALALLLLLGAFVVPQMISASQDRQTLSVEVANGGEKKVTDGLSVVVENSTPTNATVSMQDTETGIRDTSTIPEGSAANYSLPGGDGNVSAVATNNQTALINVSYSPTYGYSDSSRVVVDNIGMILILLMFLLTIGVVVGVKP